MLKPSENLLVDRFGRKHTYLRISVTDRCNLRCTYCMPAAGIDFKNKEQILSLEEIERVARVFVNLGVNKIRLTGGEPLVRKGIETLAAKISALPGLKTLAMTTNGLLLKDKAAALKSAGVDSINISLDSLKPERFAEISRLDRFDDVMNGIEAAYKVGFQKIKLNVVVMKGVNHDEVVDFVHFVKDRNINVRFIEYMPFKDNQWEPEAVFSYKQMYSLISEHFELKPLESKSVEVAKDFQLVGLPGQVSFITSMTESFCASCNRMRLTADGSVKSCLFYEPEINLRGFLRSGCSDAELTEMILYSLQMKPEAHPPMEELSLVDNRTMIEIGG